MVGQPLRTAFKRVYLLFAAAFLLAAADTPVDRAERLLYRTDYEGALKALQGLPSSGAVEYVKGRVFFNLGDFKKAASAFEKAIADSPSKSDYHLWLGRALGRRAETASIFTAPGLASKAREQFEQAVNLDPSNREALSDLFTYALEAPGFLGGGLDRAEKIAEQIRKEDPVEYHYALAQIAIKRKENQTAEQQLRAAMQLAPQQVGRVLDLAKFYARTGRLQEAETVFAQAEKVAPMSPKVKYSRAEAYIKARKNIDVAQKLLREYLNSRDLTVDDPPRQDAERLLKMAASQSGS